MKLTREITYPPYKWLSRDIKVHTVQRLTACNENFDGYGHRVVVFEDGTDNIFFDGTINLFNLCMERGHFKEVSQ